MPALILMYHDLAEDREHIPPGHRPYVLDPSTFRRQMRCVATSGPYHSDRIRVVLRRRAQHAPLH